MNSRYAEMHGFHKEELLARFAGHDADMQFPQVDWLMIWLDYFQVRGRTCRVRVCACMWVGGCGCRCGCE